VSDWTTGLATPSKHHHGARQPTPPLLSRWLLQDLARCCTVLQQRPTGWLAQSCRSMHIAQVHWSAELLQVFITLRAVPLPRWLEHSTLNTGCLTPNSKHHPACPVVGLGPWKGCKGSRPTTDVLCGGYVSGKAPRTQPVRCWSALSGCTNPSTCCEGLSHGTARHRRPQVHKQTSTSMSSGWCRTMKVAWSGSQPQTGWSIWILLDNALCSIVCGVGGGGGGAPPPR
jgi:hypothetical protein